MEQIKLDNVEREVVAELNDVIRQYQEQIRVICKIANQHAGGEVDRQRPRGGRNRS